MKRLRSLLFAALAALAAATSPAQVVTVPAITGFATGNGSVTSAACAPSNGVTCTVSTATSTPTFAIGLGAITPTSVNGVTLSGTAATTMTFPTTSATLARTDAGNTFTGHQTIEGVTSTGATGTGKLVFDTSPTLTTPALGTPASGVATNLTGTASGLTAGNVTTNANLTGPITSTGNATAVASQTGTGSTFVMQASPTLTTPVLGTATVSTLNKVTITTPATGSTLTIANGKTLAASNTLTLAGTDGTTFTLPTQSSSAVGYVGAVTYATLVATNPCNATWNGYTAFATDWGAHGATVRCDSSVTRWLPISGQVVVKRMGAPVSGIANSETIVMQVQLPAGVIQAGDTFMLYGSFSKSVVTDNLQLSVREGTAGTTADTAITGLSALTQMATTIVSAGVIHGLRVLSTTSVQRLGAVSNNASGFGTTTTTASSAATTGLPDSSSNAIWITLTVKSSSTNDTVGVQEATLVHIAG